MTSDRKGRSQINVISVRYSSNYVTSLMISNLCLRADVHTSISVSMNFIIIPHPDFEIKQSSSCVNKLMCSKK